ncbi:MAG: hypothetical protein GX942_07825 [Papillibacter sp.]|nr:hypothetical protein [Papillibacter sp.]
MLRMLHREFYKLSKSPLLIIGLVVLLGVNVAIMTKGFYTPEQVKWFYEIKAGSDTKKLTYAKHAVNLSESDAQSLEDLILEVNEVQLIRTLSFSPVFINILILPFILIGLDFYEGSIAAPLRLGVRRSRISAGKIAYFYIIAAIISILSVLLVLLMYSSSTLKSCSIAYILRCMFMHAALDLAALSLPMLLVFILKKTSLIILSGVVSCIVNVLIYTRALDNEKPSLIPIPMLQSAREAIWLPGADMATLAYVFLVAAFYIAVCSAMVQVTFSKTRLK